MCTVVSSLQLCRRGRERSTDSRYLLKRRTVAMAIITSVEASVLAMSRDCKVWLTCSIAATCSPPWCPILLPRKDRYWTEELSCMAWHSRLAPCSVRSLHPRSTLCTGQAAFCRTRKHATITLCWHAHTHMLLTFTHAHMQYIQLYSHNTMHVHEYIYNGL